MRRFVIAFLLALAYMTSPWLVAAEEQFPPDRPIVQMMLDMAWCLPSDVQPLTYERDHDSEAITFQLPNGREYVLVDVSPEMVINTQQARHHEYPNFRILLGHWFPHYGSEERISRLLLAGCFALS